MLTARRTSIGLPPSRKSVHPHSAGHHLGTLVTLHSSTVSEGHRSVRFAAAALPRDGGGRVWDLEQICIC